MDEVTTYDDVLLTIAKNYKDIETSIVNQLLLEVPNHYPTGGSYREAIWESLFKMVIPRKYCIEQGVFIIDAFGHKSREVDLAVFDELYTPYIFNYGKIKFIPIEAVAAVVQCKSEKLNKRAIEEWITSINGLITSMDSVARMANFMADNFQNGKNDLTQTATRPVKILCSLAGESALKGYKDHFDIILSVNRKLKKLCKCISKEMQSLEEWNDSLNHAIDGIGDLQEKSRRQGRKKSLETGRKHLLQDLKVLHMGENEEQEENVILSLIFQLNQLLMVINNPMLFPHHAYAQQFSDILKKSRNSKGENGDGKQKKCYKNI